MGAVIKAEPTTFSHSADRGCYGKERYVTPVLAFDVLKRRRQKRERRKLEIYRCETCGFWHMGNPSL